MMSTFLKRKALISSALLLGLFSAAQVPSALASGDHGEHVHAAVPAEPAVGMPDTSNKGQVASSQGMDHASMDHDKMAHGTMKHEHPANQPATDNHHDQ